MKRKIFALLVSCMMLLTCVVSAANYSDVPSTHDRYEAINMLSGLDIITGYPDGSFQPDKEVTRAEMAALITRMFNLTSSAVTEAPFSDVEVDYWAATNIVAAKNMKIINGFPDGTFRPQDNVTYEQAVKMIVCALNYGAAAEAKGGYPGGYIMQASQLNILKSAAYANTSPAPRGIIAQLLFNSLKVDRLVEQVNPDGTVTFVKSEQGNSVLEQFQNTKSLSNVVVVRTPKVITELNVAEINSVNADAIYVKTTAGQYIKLYVGSVTNAFDYIGQTVDVVYREDAGTGNNTLTSINRSSSVMSYENIRLSNVIALDNSGITYYTDRENERTNRIAFVGTPVVIYNERLDTAGITTLNNDLFNVINHEYAEGVISVYNSASNTLVKAKSYKTYIVDSTSSINEKITVKGGKIGGTEQPAVEKYIPYKDAYINETIIKKGSFDFKTGKVASNASTLTGYNGISKGNIIALATSNKHVSDPNSNYYEVIVSNSSVSGVINEYSTDDATSRPLIKVGTSSNLLVSRNIDRYELGSTIVANLNAKFSLDPFNEIGYVSDVKTASFSLGLPVSIETGTGFDAISEVKIYNVDTGSVEPLRFYNEVSNDPRVTALKEIVGGVSKLNTSSLYKYTLKNGQINELKPVEAGGEDFNYVAEKTAATEVANIKKDSTGKITFDGKNITYNASTTKIIFIGSGNSTETVTPSTGSMINNTNYKGKVYQFNRVKSGTTSKMQYVIIRPFEGLTKDSPTYIVESIGGTTAVGNGVNAVTVNAYSFAGTSTSGNSSSTKPVLIESNVAAALNLQKGDVFSYYTLPTAQNVDIDSLKTVYILARANEIASGTYPTNGYMVKTDNAFEASGAYNADYRYWGVVSGESELTAPTAGSMYCYYMGIPVAYMADEDSNIYNLRIARESASKLPVLPGDTATITTIQADLENTSYYSNYTITGLSNIFVYDASLPEADKLQQIKGADLVREYFDNMKTIENNTTHYDTIMVKAYDYSNGNTLYNLYIIKDARP